jgi:hypothetical protein
MQPNDSKPTFPLIRSAVILSALVAAMAAVLMAILPVFAAEPEAARSAVLMMAAAVWLSAIAGLLPAARFGPRGLWPAVYAWFAGAALRILICLAALVWLIKQQHLPAGPVTITLLVTYLPMLFVETGQVVRFICNSDFSSCEVIA